MSNLRQRKSESLRKGERKDMVPAQAETLLADALKGRLPEQPDIDGEFSSYGSAWLKKCAVLVGPLLLSVIAVFVLRMTGDRYPLRYAICSREGAVYISPEKTADCVIINKDVVEYYGNLDETRTRFGDLDSLGSLAVWPGKLSKKAGLKIFYTRQGRAVYPGTSPGHSVMLSCLTDEQALPMHTVIS